MEVKAYDPKVLTLADLPEMVSELRYSPDQPRDDHGRFGEGSGETYHGTSEANVNSILEKGLTAEESWNGASVYSTDDKDYALSYAAASTRSYALGEKIEASKIPDLPMAVLVLDASKAGPLKNVAGTYKVFASKQDVPASAIKRIELYKLSEIDKKPGERVPFKVIEQTSKRADADELLLIVPPSILLGANDELRYSPDQPRDDHGRFGADDSGMLDATKVFGSPVQDLPTDKAVGKAIGRADEGDFDGTKEVALDSLTPTQDYTGADKVSKIADKYDDKKASIAVIKVGDKNYIYDGHHTAAAAIKAGKTTIKARIIEARSELRYSPDQEREPNGQFGSGGTVVKDISGAMEHVVGTAAMHALVRVGDKLLDKDGNKVTVKEKGEHTLKVYDHKANDYKELAKSEVSSYKWGSRDDTVVDPAEPPKVGVTTLYIGRHGATEEDEQHQFCGQTDSPLSPVGLENAKHLAVILGQYEFDQVFCSDLERARETAQACAGNRVVTPLYSLRTWGIGSDLSGQDKTPMLENLKTFYIRNPNVVPTGDNAESINQAQARQSGGLWAILAQTPIGHANLVIAHSAMFKVVGRTFNAPTLRVGPGGLIRIEVTPDGVATIAVLFIGRIALDAPDILAEAVPVLRYSPDQPRDDHGRFGEGTFDGAKARAAAAAIPSVDDVKSVFRATDKSTNDVLAAAERATNTPSGKKAATAQEVEISTLVSKQDGVGDKRLDRAIDGFADGSLTSDLSKGPEAAYVIRHDGENHIIDGNHRLAALKLAGVKTAKVLFLDVNKIVEK